MNTLNYNHIRFLKSAEAPAHLPEDSGREVAFAGRSNAGKSSALNALTRMSHLAKTSKTPGKTQLINFFELTEDKRLVDLPGYGYAKVNQTIKNRWEKFISHYITERQSLTGIILLMDIRHPLKPFDVQMIEWTVSHDLPIHILLNKSDKLTRSAGLSTLLQIQKALSGYEGLITVQLFSALRKTGIEEVHQKLNEWLNDLGEPEELEGDESEETEG